MSKETIKQPEDSHDASQFAEKIKQVIPLEEFQRLQQELDEERQKRKEAEAKLAEYETRQEVEATQKRQEFRELLEAGEPIPKEKLPFDMVKPRDFGEGGKELFDRVANGEVLLIGNHGCPKAALIPYRPEFSNLPSVPVGGFYKAQGPFISKAVAEGGIVFTKRKKVVGVLGPPIILFDSFEDNNQ